MTQTPKRCRACGAELKPDQTKCYACGERILLLKEASPDDPLYKRGFVVGVTRPTRQSRELPADDPIYTRGGFFVGVRRASRPPAPSPSTKPALTKEQIEASKPRRDQFASDDEFDEALTRWMSREGRSPILRKPDAPPST